MSIKFDYFYKEASLKGLSSTQVQKRLKEDLPGSTNKDRKTMVRTAIKILERSAYTDMMSRNSKPIVIAVKEKINESV